MMPLSMANQGEPNIIKKVGGKDDVRSFLEKLGFVVGGTVTVISETNGNLIVNVKDSRVAIGKEMANKIMVQCKSGWREYNMKEGEKEMTLKDVACGQTVKVTKLTGEGPVKRRIMDMGITKGVEIYVRKVAPLGDPIEVTVRGYELSIRKADAQMIEVAQSVFFYIIVSKNEQKIVRLTKDRKTNINQEDRNVFENCISR